MTKSAGLDPRRVDHLIGFHLALAEAVSRRHYEQHIGGPMELRPIEFTLLCLLLDAPDATPKQLAGAVQAKAPQLTVLLDRMSARGLLQRHRSPADGRSVRVRLTARGRALARRAHRVSLAMEAPMLAALTQGEQGILRELLVKLARRGIGEAG